ncbi:hypothetical protein HPB50_025204 [Hyalomma asiaticum]|uniref:Uncharacterized protein n=1 Tax=Hyalomma asiaticum TaxID=266040 RepID=A0ACB7S223_HYAAI|nr:hypothetical protein HPB50_025204 [Hyalomma asiaticum]
MQGPEALHLEDALEDNPQMRSMVNLFERDAHNLDKYVRVMYEHANRIWNAEKELADATASLAFHMRQYDSQDFPLDTDPDSILRATLRQLSSSLEERKQLVSQERVENKMGGKEREQALGRYCKQSRRKDTDRQRLDLSEELYLANRRFHTVSLQFYAQLNALQYRRKIALIEPLLGYVHSMKSLFGVAHETMHTAEQDEFLANIATSLGDALRYFCHSFRVFEVLLPQFESLVNHPLRLPKRQNVIPDKLRAAEGQGSKYRRKIAGMVSRWDRVYFYILGCHLMHIPKGESVGSAVMEIDRGTVAHALDEDRRNVFQISNGKKSVVLQALSEPERDEWITTVMNVAAECHPGGRSHSVPKEAPAAKTERTPSLPNAAAPGSMPAAAAAAPSQERKMARPRPATQQDLKELANTPIQFDMFSPSEDKSSSGHSPKDGPAVRINPFDQCGSSITMESAKDASCSFWEAFTVRFLGSMQVPCDRGDQLVCETMRLILAARMAHNVFKMAESHMVVCNALAVAANIALKDFMGQQQHQQQEKLAQKEDEKNEELLQKLKLSEDENALFPSSAKKVHSGATAGEEAAAALLEAGDAKAT